MVNLFRRGPAEPGSLTAGLLALLEHCDPSLLNGLLERAGIDSDVPVGAELAVEFPAPGGPTATGVITAPQLRVTLITQAPGERWEPQAAAALDGTVLAVTMGGRAPEHVHGLTWEQVDRWLAAAAERYDPESRTGFLVRQFRAYLAELGIEYFAGFAPEQLEGAADAFAGFNQFHQTADRFFQRFAAALAAGREGAAQVRQSRAEDLLTGYFYRDYGGAPFGPAGFLRLAFHVPEQELQLSFWVVPGVGTDAHERLREALSGNGDFLEALRGLEEKPLLWLWSPGGDRKLPLEAFRPALLTEIDWAQYQTGIQRSVPFESLTGEGLVDRVTDLMAELLAALAPVLSPQLH
ncbi:MAG: hypothetical protein JWN15_196 [Firmicutes bacterium]|nr:hypothetical protein [Bacillota bacterium]